MKGYKAIEDWNGFKKGDVVPSDVADDFLSQYAKFEDQSILEQADVKENKETKQESDDSPSSKSTTKKKTTKNK